MRCPQHDREYVCLSCHWQRIGESTSPAKALAARRNGAKGGRPRKGLAGAPKRPRGRPRTAQGQ